jgi:hypothetical protein
VPSKRLRVGVLFVLLAVVAMWAVGRTRQRRARTRWDAPVAVAVLVLGEAPPATVAGLDGALAAVGRRLDEERTRFRPGSTGPAVTFELVGPLYPERLPPTAPPGDGLLDRALHALDLWRATRAAHASAPGFEPGAFDARVYLVAAPGEGRFAEGIGEAGGEVGVVRAGLDGAPLLAATAVAHEVLHALGASDKYDAAGHAVAPAGLVEPDLRPPYPQRFAELMVGEVPLGPGAGRLPADAAELGIGPVTAAEIGWTGPATGDGHGGTGPATGDSHGGTGPATGDSHGGTGPTPAR